MTEYSNLFEPLTIGTLTCPNRVWMAPLTRNRSQSDGTPRAMAAKYYRQRASAGLIISEATCLTTIVDCHQQFLIHIVILFKIG